MMISHRHFMQITIKTSLLSLLFIGALFSVVQAQFWADKEPELLPEEQAFSVFAEIDNGALNVNWSVAEGYYLYRDNFRIESRTEGVEIGDITFPKGTIEDDPEFGKVEVYFFNANLRASINSRSNFKTNNKTNNKTSNLIELVLHAQGCNKPVGVCYPPMQRLVTVDYNVASNQENELQTSTNNNLDQAPDKSFLGYVLAALGAGLLLSFTPCVLPMIPILAGIIAGQNNPGRAHSGWLAICYVAGTVVTYLIAGWVAGATGSQLQAHFQNPWVIGFICALLVLLASSLFGWFKIQLPSSVQSKLNATSIYNRSASLTSFVLGLISALVVGACVSPILIVALGAAITQGDPVLGAAIMGAMAVGMGALLILFGFGAGWLLPKTGAWMQQVQVLFGFMVLGVAVYLLESLSMFPILYLWAALLLCAGFYCWQFGSQTNKPLITSFLRAIALACLIWGAMALIGGSLNGNNILKPLNNLLGSLSGNLDTQNTNNASNSFRSELPFTSTTTLAGAQTLLKQAKLANQPVLIDFYADWCLDCKRMHRTTFREASVETALSNWALIEIDVTDTSKDSEEVKRFFGVFGPPATLFIASDGEEHKHLRQYGYLNEADFLTIIQQANLAASK